MTERSWGEKFAYDQLVSHLNSASQELRARATRLEEFTGLIKKEWDEGGDLKHSAFLSNVTREVCDSARNNTIQGTLPLIVQFAAELVYPRTPAEPPATQD